jgi:hypothetical protein
LSRSVKVAGLMVLLIRIEAWQMMAELTFTWYFHLH